MRPERVVAVTGTGTGVGKTWVAAAVLARLRSDGLTVAARKPVQSFDPDAGPTDADVLAAATGEPPTEVCPAHRWYERAMAPPMAAEALGRPAFTVADLAGELRWPGGLEIGLVETVGGPRSPVAADGDSAALVAALSPDVVLVVADAGLGAINAVRLAAHALDEWPLIVVLNRFDGTDLQCRNRDWLERDGYLLTTDPAAAAVTSPNRSAALVSGANRLRTGWHAAGPS